MSDHALLTLSDHLAADRRISADEALELRGAIFPDGVVTRQEADVLVSLEGRVANSDSAWSQAFVEAIVDHALQSGIYPDHVGEEAAGWLMTSFAAPSADGLEALLRTVERAESVTEDFMAFVRERVAESVAGKALDAAAVERIRRTLFASSGAGGVAVTDAEVRWLFALDAESDGRDNDPAWSELFVNGALCHVVGRSAPAFLSAKNIHEREVRFENRMPLTPLAMLRSLLTGGFSRYMQALRQPDAVTGMEQAYEASNAQVEADARLTAEEAAKMLGLSERDGKQTANERALLSKLRELETASRAA